MSINYAFKTLRTCNANIQRFSITRFTATLKRYAPTILDWTQLVAVPGLIVLMKRIVNRTGLVIRAVVLLQWRVQAIQHFDVDADVITVCRDEVKGLTRDPI